MVQVKNCFSHGERLVSWAVRHTASLGFGFWNIYLIFHIQSRGIIHSFFFKVFIYLSAWGLSWGMWDLQSSLYCNRIFSCSVWILSCGMWDLVSWLGIEPQPPALGAWNLSHWTTREYLSYFLKMKKFFTEKLGGHYRYPLSSIILTIK